MDNSGNKKEKWFDWHISPEEPIKLRSFVEMFVFLFIVCICVFLYYRWNVVPMREFEFQLEDLSNGKVYDTNKKSLDSVRRVFANELTCIVPMTTHDELYKGNNSFCLFTKPLLSSENYSNFMKYSFLKDSVRNINNKMEYDLSQYVGDNDICLSDLNNDVFFNKFDVKDSLELYRQTSLKAFDVSPELYPIIYLMIKESLPYFSVISDKDKPQNTNQMFSRIYLDSNSSITSEFYQYLNYSYPSSILSNNKSLDAHWYNKLNIYWPFTGGLPGEKPSWGRLEDISQAYVSLKLRSSTIDSIVFNIDFVGASEFSHMDPMPDKIGMSKITFSDPVKIFKIKSNGLKFHVRFKELENLQQIRVFTVTAIMSAFIMAFVVFIILAVYKIRKKILSNNKTIILSVLKVVFGGLILYNLLYWTFMLLVLSNGTVFICNLLSIPLTLLILLITCKRERIILHKYLVKRMLPKKK